MSCPRSADFCDKLITTASVGCWICVSASEGTTSVVACLFRKSGRRISPMEDGDLNVQHKHSPTTCIFPTRLYIVRRGSV
ncbi:hypothetical protein FRB95_002206 [Tulasnella sp. JGI-2019a]|nr:hypothetical protein FRB95_002206 [Tulasnella sp. JGI-2019a]